MTSRRILSFVAAGAVVGTPFIPLAHAADPLPAGYPTPGCFTYTDPKGDATFEVLGDSDLDIVGFALETTATSLKAYASVPQMTANGPGLPFDGHRFTLKFTFNGHVLAASGSDYANGTGVIRDGLASTGHAGHTTQLSVDTPPIDPTNPDPALVTSPGYVDSGLKVTFDYKNHWVLWDLPIADIEKYGGAKFTGDITQLSIASQTDEYAIGSVWDTAPDNDANGAATGVWTVGDNKCFGGAGGTVTGAAATLVNAGATSVQYGDTAKVGAKLTDAAGKPVAGQTVTFKLGSTKVAGTTGSNGVATASITAKSTAGKYQLIASTTGDDAATLTTPFTIAVEKTKLTLAATKSRVTAKLLDDDKHAVAGQRISFTLNGKKGPAVKTNSKGVASIKVQPGTKVLASYAGVKGKYTAAKATRKV